LSRMKKNTPKIYEKSLQMQPERNAEFIPQPES
jgi:hypothetical protein